ITVLLDVRHIPQVGPLQWGWLMISAGMRLFQRLGFVSDSPRSGSFSVPVSAISVQKPTRIVTAKHTHDNTLPRLEPDSTDFVSGQGRTMTCALWRRRPLIRF